MRHSQLYTGAATSGRSVTLSLLERIEHPLQYEVMRRFILSKLSRLRFLRAH